MFVDHLGHGIFEQHDVLIKRLDLPLQFDAVNEIDCHWNMFLAQGIKERVL
jgi:hypothetical protein